MIVGDKAFADSFTPMSFNFHLVIFGAGFIQPVPSSVLWVSSLSSFARPLSDISVLSIRVLVLVLCNRRSLSCFLMCIATLSVY